jgi:integrase
MAGKRANGEASYRQRPDGSWEVRAYFDGVRRSFYGKTRGEVAAKIKEAQRRVEQGAKVTSSSERLTLGAWLDSWLERVKPTIRQSTWIRYGSLLAHPKRRLGNASLTKLTPQQIETLYAELLEQGLSSTTVHHVHMALHKALKDAYRKGVVPRNVSELVNVPQMNVHEIHPLTREQAQRFLEASKGERLEALFALGISTGMRQGELLALHWHDLDLDAGTLQVRFSVRLQQGSFVFSEPKTKHGKRKIILSPEVVEVLRAHRVCQLQERLVAGTAWTDQDLVFCNESGAPLDGILVYRWPFRRVLHKAGLPQIRFHDLRHTAATLMLLTGVPAKVVSEMLGHATVAITLDTYSHVQPSMQENATAAMRSVLWGSRGGAPASGGANGGGNAKLEEVGR